MSPTSGLFLCSAAHPSAEKSKLETDFTTLNFLPFLINFFSLFLSAEVKMPSGQVDKPVIEDNRDGTVSIKYDPREEGIHELAVKYNGEHVQGSPVIKSKM